MPGLISSYRAKTCLAALVAGILICLDTIPVASQTPGIAARQRSERKTFSDAEIVDGFMKTAFGAEYHLAGRVDRIRKYTVPVRVFIEGTPNEKRKSQIEKVVADIGRYIQHLDIAMAKSRDAANSVITFVHERDLNKTIVAFYGADRARDIRDNLDPQCLSGFRKNEAYEIQHADVILTVDNSTFVFFDCAYEEILQSLGPINDTDTVPWTMFNDDVSMGFFDVYDQYLMNILYDPRIKAGMTVQQVRELLPAVLPDVRAWVAKVNNLPSAAVR